MELKIERWEILSERKDAKYKYVKAKCSDCGEETAEIRKDSLKNRQCLCVRPPYKTDVKPGDKFGYLTIIEELPTYHTTKSSSRMFRVECVCGNVVDKQLKSMKQTTRCCGCTHKKPGYAPSVHVGDKFKTKQGFDVVVTEYKDGYNIKAKFMEPVEYEFDTWLSSLKTGSIKNKYHPSVYGIGFVGVGPYDSKKDKQAHSHFSGMLERCYEQTALNKRKTYAECEVLDIWFNFQTFAEWCYSQIGFGEKGWQLDKDILLKGNKLYSPETCCFVPSEINGLFTKRQAERGNCPIGVYEHSKGRYRASCSNEFNGEKKFSGLLRDTMEEAFQDYKEYKEKVIKQRADFYKDRLDPRVYKALYEYQVEITD